MKVDASADLTFGGWLKRHRRSLGLTQEQLAQQLHCSTIMLRKIEAEERRPSAQLIEGLAAIMNIPQGEWEKFQNFARGKVESFLKEPDEKYPWHTEAGLPRSNLPTSNTSFIGREQELSAVREYVLDASVRLVTLIGPPGIGKTRLGLEVTRGSPSDFRDGVCFVMLGSLERASQIGPAIFQSLGFVESKNQFSVEQLLESIGDKQILLMLDNLEHLIEDSASLASRLLSACSGLKIIATSRESLRIPGEWLYPVPILGFPKGTELVDLRDISNFPALTLFAERARAVSPSFTLTPENLPLVAAVCERLDGVPLAIELIASRVRFLSPQKLLAQMDEQFILSADGMRAVPARQKTLHNAIQWSYSLLSRDEQELLMRLSVFSGGFTTDAAEAIADDFAKDKPINDLIRSLLDKSLIQRLPSEQDEPRFNMLRMIRDYALDQLRKAGKESDIRDKHLAYFLDLAEHAEEEIHGPDQIAWMEQIEKNHNNFQTMLDWCVTNGYTESALRLLGALAWTWWIRCHYSELHSWFDKIRSMEGIHDYPARYAKILNRVAAQSSEVSESREARSLLEESRNIWSMLGEDGEPGLAECLNWLALEVSYSEGAMADARSLAEQSLGIHRKHNHPWGCAHSLLQIGDVESLINRSASARPFFEQSLDLFDQVRDRWGKSQVYQSLGRMHLDLGEYDQARSRFEEKMKLDQSLQYISGMIGGLRDLGSLHFVQGLDEQAQKYYEEILAMCHQHGMKPDHYSLFRLGLLALRQNNMSVAARRFVEMYNAIEGIDTISESRDLCWGFAAVASGTDQPERAARLSGAGQAILDKTGFMYPPFFRGILESHIQIARQQLGEVAFEALQTEGRVMTIEQAIAYALEE